MAKFTTDPPKSTSIHTPYIGCGYSDISCDTVHVSTDLSLDTVAMIHIKLNSDTWEKIVALLTDRLSIIYRGYDVRVKKPNTDSYILTPVPLDSTFKNVHIQNNELAWYDCKFGDISTCAISGRFSFTVVTDYILVKTSEPHVYAYNIIITSVAPHTGTLRFEQDNVFPNYVSGQEHSTKPIAIEDIYAFMSDYSVIYH